MFPWALVLLVMLAAGACPKPAPRPPASDSLAFRQCMERRATARFRAAKITITNENKRPGFSIATRPGDVLLMISDPAGRVDTSPGQVFLPNKERGAGGRDADGNSAPAPDDWLIPGATQFAVVVELTQSERYEVGLLGPCITVNSPLIGENLVFGLNVVQAGAASPLTNRWTGSIGIDVVRFSVP